MTIDTRDLVQQMQAHATPPPPDADPVQLVREGYRQVIPLAGAVVEVETVEDYKVSSVTPAIGLRLYRARVDQHWLNPHPLSFPFAPLSDGDSLVMTSPPVRTGTRMGSH